MQNELSPERSRLIPKASQLVKRLRILDIITQSLNTFIASGLAKIGQQELETALTQVWVQCEKYKIGFSQEEN